MTLMRLQSKDHATLCRIAGSIMRKCAIVYHTCLYARVIAHVCFYTEREQSDIHVSSSIGCAIMGVQVATVRTLAFELTKSDLKTRLEERTKERLKTVSRSSSGFIFPAVKPEKALAA